MTETRTTPDADYLNRLLAWAEHEEAERRAGRPSEWDQGAWIEAPDIHDVNNLPPLVLGCGTSCCIAGKVAWDAGGRPTLQRSGYGREAYWTSSIVDFPDGPEQVDVSEFAEQRLGLSETQANVLFNGGNDIEDLRVLIPAIIAGVDGDALFRARGHLRDDDVDLPF